MEHKWHSAWPPDVPRSFKPEKSLPKYLRDNAVATPDKIALSFYGYDMTYQELDETVGRFAGAIANLGAKKGDRVALFMENCPQFVISYFGTLLAGCIVVTLNPMFKHEELEYELNDSGAETLVALDFLYPEVEKIKDRVKLNNVILTAFGDYLPSSPTLPRPPIMERPKVTFPETLDFLELLRESSPRAMPEIVDLKKDIALLQYTGGTTGLPKGAMITHYTLAHNTIGSMLWWGYTKDDEHLNVLPNFHIMGMVQSMCTPLCSGGHMIILSRFTPDIVASALVLHKCTVWVTITTMIIALLEWPEVDKYDFGSIRIVCYGGAPIPILTLVRLKRLFPNAKFGEGYGLTENCSPAVLTPLHHPKDGFIGIPFIGTDVKIVDLGTGLREVNPMVEGEIILKGPIVMKGYWNKQQETKETLRKGWLYTGDIGKMDEEGYVSMVGRKKELIKCSGYSVFPTEVEELLHKHPAVAEVSVIGVPDPYRGETIKAFIVLEPQYKGKVQEEEIVDWAKENMAAYKRPRVVEFREALPKSSVGKVLRRVLVEEENEKRK